MLWTRGESPPKLASKPPTPGNRRGKNARLTAGNLGEEIMDHFSRIHHSVALLSVVPAPTRALAAPASAQETFKLGVVTFLSGPAADSFGVPARNGAQYVIDQLNQGSAPSPYEKVGCGGMKIEPVVIDENGGATKQVQELRNLYQRDNVDAVIGYIGSGGRPAGAPSAGGLKNSRFA